MNKLSNQYASEKVFLFQQTEAYDLVPLCDCYLKEVSRLSVTKQTHHVQNLFFNLKNLVTRERGSGGTSYPDREDPASSRSQLVVVIL